MLPILKKIDEGNFSLQFSDVTVDIEDQTILHNININLTEKKIGIVGNNGSGKSTFARCASGLKKIRKSKENHAGIKVHNRDIRDLKGEAWKYVNMTFQIPDQQIIMPNVKDELEYGLKHCGFSKESIQEKVDFALGFLNVKSDHACHALSAGKKRLLCLFSVLLLEPETIFLDEPTTFLDMPSKIQIMDLLEQIPQQLIVITHDFFLIEHFPRVLCFHEGKVIQDGTYHEVIDTYKKLW